MEIVRRITVKKNVIRFGDGKFYEYQACSLLIPHLWKGGYAFSDDGCERR